MTRARLYSLGRDVLETLALSAVIFVLMHTFVARTYAVYQPSMERTLEPGQHVAIDMLTPRFEGYRRGDIVIFDPPEPWATELRGTPLIKRVIGVGGDRVAIRDGRVAVNGVALNEPYVYAGQATEPVTSVSAWTVPEGSVFVLGDHRGISEDSRTFGTVSVSRIIGRAWLRFLPFDSFGVLPAPTYPPLTGVPQDDASSQPAP